MSVDKKILEEIKKYNTINKYISEQETPLDVAPDSGEELELGGEEFGSEGAVDDVVQTVDVESDPDVEVVGEPGNSPDVSEGGTEELDITDLVTAQNDMSAKQEEYMDSMIDRLNDLTTKLGDMDTIINKINDLETKVDKYRQKTPEEKLQLRSLDSYPYNQKLSDFFMDKEADMEKTGKNDYVLTSDEVENFTDRDIKTSFDAAFEDED